MSEVERAEVEPAEAGRPEGERATGERREAQAGEDGQAGTREQVAGVLGGMGPQATVDFLARIVRATPAHDDAGHIRILIDCNPKVPSRIARLLEGRGEDPEPVLAQMARGLQAQGADFLAIPCNTAHHYLPGIQCAVRIPVLDMVSLAVAGLARRQPSPRRVGMLAMPAVRKVGLYAARLAASGREALFPDAAGEADLLTVIRAVKAGAVTGEVRERYQAVAAALLAQGADALLIACTELSVLGSPAGAGIPVIDALDALVEETVRRGLGG